VVVQGLNMERGRQDCIKRHRTIGNVLQQNGTSSGALTGALGLAFSAASTREKESLRDVSAPCDAPCASFCGSALTMLSLLQNDLNDFTGNNKISIIFQNDTKDTSHHVPVSDISFTFFTPPCPLVCAVR
jgi:hypothetical protein